MPETLLNNEPLVRMGCYFGTFGLMALLEVLLPRRGRSLSRWIRWPSNLGIAVLNTLLVRILLPSAAVGFADFAGERNWGMLNWFSMPYVPAIFISVLILDLAIYLQHMVFHTVPLLWRLHRMHHTDLEFDVTTGARFHPLEILLSLGIKILIVMALGPPVVAVLIFEVLLSTTSLFNHANVYIPPKADRILRWFVVTPDMHRVHHSIIRRETDSNFGFNVPWWDRLFGTYIAQPSEGHDEMAIGIEQFRNPRDLGLDRLLLQPWR